MDILRRLSPVKGGNRDKPLPCAPGGQGSPEKRASLHSNVSAHPFAKSTSTQATTNTTATGTSTGTRRRLRNMLSKSKLREPQSASAEDADGPLPTPSDRPLPAPPSAGPSRHAQSKTSEKRSLRSRASLSQLIHPKPQMAGPEKMKKEQDLRLATLSRKVSNLEAQLMATKKELLSVSEDVSRHGSANVSRSTSGVSCGLPRPLSRRSSMDVQFEQERARDVERWRSGAFASFGGDEEYDGLVDDLLGRSPGVRDRSFLHLEEEDEDEKLGVRGSMDLDAAQFPGFDFPSTPTGKEGRDLHPALRPTRSSERKRQRSDEHPLDPSNTSDAAPALPERAAKRTRRAASFDDFSAMRDKNLPPSPAPSFDPVPLDSPLRPSSLRTKCSPNPSPTRLGSAKARGSMRRVSAPEASTSTQTSRPSSQSQPPKKGLPKPPLETISGNVQRLGSLAESVEEKDPDDAPGQPRKSRHRRNQSIIIPQDALDAAVGKGRPKSRGKQDVVVDEHGGSNWSILPSVPPSCSPRRKDYDSPGRLERVEEEYEWDEDVF